MKKKETKDQEQERNPRRLRLDRETIRVLHDPVLLKLVGAAGTTSTAGVGCGNDD
jgi:hypothetical protein